MLSKAPIAVFIFNRPDHLRKTLSSLLRCRGVNEAKIVVFADGPRHPGQRLEVEQARQVARELLGSRATYRFSAENRGLAASIIGGVSELVAVHGRVIVLEDDFELAPGFLEFMNAGLDRYETCDSVHLISGYVYEVPELADRNTGLFLPLISSWGWATWERAWVHFDPQAIGWEQLDSDRQMRRRFNFGGVYNHALMLRRQMRGRLDSWGVRWYWSVFRRDGLGLFPPQSLVRNIGMDGSGTHGRGRFRGFDVQTIGFPAGSFEMPDNIECAWTDLEAVRKAIWRQNGGWVGLLIDRVRGVLDRLGIS